MFKIEPSTSMFVHVKRDNYMTGGAYTDLAYFGVRQISFYFKIFSAKPITGLLD